MTGPLLTLLSVYLSLTESHTDLLKIFAFMIEFFPKITGDEVLKNLNSVHEIILLGNLSIN